MEIPYILISVSTTVLEVNTPFSDQVDDILYGIENVMSGQIDSTIKRTKTTVVDHYRPLKQPLFDRYRKQSTKVITDSEKGELN